MSTFALSALRTRAQEESDNVNSTFVTDAEWTRLINGSYTELYGTIVEAFGNDYYVQTPYSFVTDGISSQFALPSDFFKLLGVDLLVQSPNYYVTLKPFAFNDRNRFALFNNPIPAAGQTVRMWYVPALTALSGDSDLTVDIPNGWEEYIIVDAAMKALAKEESDVSVMMARKNQLLARIQGEAENRDAGNPAKIVDVFGNRSRGMQYRLNGSNLWLIGGNTPAWGFPGDGITDYPWELP